MTDLALAKILNEEDMAKIRVALREEIIDAIHEEIERYNVINIEALQEIFDSEIDKMRDQLAEEFDRQIREQIKITFCGEEIKIKW